MKIRVGEKEGQCWMTCKHVWMACNPVSHEFPTDTTILTLESLKSLTFLVSRRRFSEISQGNEYTHCWQTSEDQQGAHHANHDLQEFCEHRRSPQGERCMASRLAHMRMHKYGNSNIIDLAEKPGERR
jgi:hypothetical protein